MATSAQLCLLKEVDNPVIVKSNALIESRYKLTLEEQKLVSLAASQIPKNTDEFGELQFRVSDIQAIFNKSNKNIYDQVNEVSDRLMTRFFEIRDDKAGSWEKYSWVNRARYKNGLLTIQFSDDAKPHLLDLKANFTRYELRQIASMSSGYGIRLFEHCKQYQRLGERTFAVSDDYNPKGYQVFSTAMGYGDTYPRYSNMKQKVLLPAIEQVRKHSTDFKNIEFEEIKVSRRVVMIKFSWAKQASDQLVELADENASFKELLRLGVQESVARKIISEHSHEYIEANLNYVYRLDPSKCNAAYFVSAIKDNYAGCKIEQNSDGGAEKESEINLEEYSGRQREFIETVILQADQQTQSIFGKYGFGDRGHGDSPHIIQLWAEFRQKHEDLLDA